MVKDKGCASVAATANDVDSETVMFCPKPGRLFLSRLKCIFLVVARMNRKTEITRKAFIETSHTTPLTTKALTDGPL